MRIQSLIVLAIAAAFGAACGKRVPQPNGAAPGTPYISWIIMSGDSDNPDQEFVCQSDPRSDCVVPASRPDSQVFSDVHFYYHSAGAETKYTGSVNIGLFQGSAQSHEFTNTVTVQKNESITNQSITGIVTSTPGTYAVTLDFVATLADTGKSQPVRAQVAVVVK